eukprot:1713147-Prymnesium_polylepis.2
MWCAPRSAEDSGDQDTANNVRMCCRASVERGRVSSRASRLMTRRRCRPRPVTQFMSVCYAMHEV